MIEDVILLIVSATWALLSTVSFVSFLWVSGKNRELLKDIGRLLLWIVGIFSAGSMTLMIREESWRNFFNSLALNADTFRIALALCVWVLGSVVFAYTFRWFKHKLG